MSKQLFGIEIGLASFVDPTLLLIGDAFSFRRLAKDLIARQRIVLEQKMGKLRTALHFVPTCGEGRLSRQENVFLWQISGREARSTADLLSELSSSGRPVHAYLDPTTNETAFEIIASIGEYDPAVVFDR